LFLIEQNKKVHAAGYGNIWPIRPRTHLVGKRVPGQDGAMNPLHSAGITSRPPIT
jgi:hypothetical protein